MTSTKQYSGLLIEDHADRRWLPRFSGDPLTVALRTRGSFRRLTAQTLDFNRYGVALLATRPLSLDRPVFLELSHPQMATALSVVGVVHNCVRQNDRFRCGIRFRLHSSLQKRVEQAERGLLDFERLLSGDSA